MPDFLPAPNRFISIQKAAKNFLIRLIKYEYRQVRDNLNWGLLTFLFLCLRSFIFPTTINEGIKNTIVISQERQTVISASSENHIFYNGYSIENGQYCRMTTSAYQYWLPIYSDKQYDIFEEKFGSTIQVTDPEEINPAHAIYFLMRDRKAIVRFTIPLLNIGGSSQLVQFEYLYQYPNGNQLWLPQNSQVLKKPIDLSKDTDIGMSVVKVNDTDIQVEIIIRYFDLINGGQQFQTFTSETILNVNSPYSQQDSFTFGLGTLKGQCIKIKKGFNS